VTDMTDQAARDRGCEQQLTVKRVVSGKSNSETGVHPTVKRVLKGLQSRYRKQC